MYSLLTNFHCVSLVRDFALLSIFSAESRHFWYILQDFLFGIGIWAAKNLRSSHHASVVSGYRHVWLCFCSCRPNHNSEKNMNVIFEVPNIQAQQYEKWLKAMYASVISIIWQTVRPIFVKYFIQKTSIYILIFRKIKSLLFLQKDRVFPYP